MILLDTCAALWWVFDKDKFSKKARSYIDKMEASFGYISSITIWEIGLKIKRKKIEIPISIEELTSSMKQSGVIKIVPVDEVLYNNLATSFFFRRCLVVIFLGTV